MRFWDDKSPTEVPFPFFPNALQLDLDYKCNLPRHDAFQEWVMGNLKAEKHAHTLCLVKKDVFDETTECSEYSYVATE